MTLQERIQKRVAGMETNVISVRMSSQTLDDLDKICFDQGISRNALIRDFVLVALGLYERELDVPDDATCQ